MKMFNILKVADEFYDWFSDIFKDLELLDTSKEEEQINKEEECKVCKKTKDIGKKCWWCGN